jgi:CxxC-x17-CxxC domain-containing protein
MSAGDPQEYGDRCHPADGRQVQDKEIICLDCSHTFIWTAGEQKFFIDKELLNPPKRCKECKREKNFRLDAIEAARVTGKRCRVEIKTLCAKCHEQTTVPFYPSQGRPVYCRACFLELKEPGAPAVAGSLL